MAIKVIIITVILAAIIIPIAYLSAMSMRMVTGNAAMTAEKIDHYEIYCSTEPIRSLDGLELIQNNTEKRVPNDCLRMPTAHVAYVPMDSDGNQVAQPDYELY